ncbi:MAG: zinc-binding dehydrogenase [Steroidobacteraceae bacterium]
MGSRDTFEELNRIVSQHRLQPAIDPTFACDQLTEALTYFKASRQFGKVALTY